MTSIVAIVLSLYYPPGYNADGLEYAPECLLGGGILGKTSFFTRFVIAVVVGFLLGLVYCAKTIPSVYPLGKYNHLVAIESSLTLFFYVFILSIVYYVRI